MELYKASLDDLKNAREAVKERTEDIVVLRATWISSKMRRPRPPTKSRTRKVGGNGWE